MVKFTINVVIAAVIALLSHTATSACSSEQEFIGAVYNNDMEKLPFCVQAYDVNMKSSKSLTPLMISANNHYARVVNYLLDHGADPNLRFSSAEQFFDGAGQVAYGSIVATVLAVVSPAHVSNVVGTLLLGFVDKQKIEDAMNNFSFDQLKDFSDAFVHYIPAASTTAACLVGFTAVGHSAERAHAGDPLMAALRSGNLSALSARDMLDLHDSNINNKVVAFCVAHCNAATVNWLIDKGVDFNTHSLVETLAETASDTARKDILKLLRSRGLNIDMKNDAGKTALMIAAGRDDLDAVQTLLDLGADPTITTGSWLTSKQAVNFAKSDVVVKLLREAAKSGQ